MTALTSPTADPTPAVAAHDRRWWDLDFLGLAQLVVILDATIVNIALPSAVVLPGGPNPAGGPGPAPAAGH